MNGHLHSARDIDDESSLGKIYDQRVIKRLPRYLGRVKKWMVLGAIGMIVRSLASLALPYLVAVAIDDYIQAGSLDGFHVIGLLFIGAAILVWVGRYMETLYLAYAGRSVLFHLRTEMFDHLQRLSLGFYDRHQVGKLMSRVQNDVQQLQELFTSDILTVITSALTLVGIATVMLVMNVRLALLTLTAVPALGITLLIWQRYARRAFLRVRRAIAGVNARFQENISGVRTVQSLSREDVNYEQFDATNQENMDANISATRLSAIMWPTVMTLTAAATGLVVAFGGFQVLAGEMGIGILLAFLLYVQRFFNPVIELAMVYTELQRAMASGARIFELLDVEPEIKDRTQAMTMTSTDGAITLRDVSFSYQPGLEVLRHINLVVSPGETVAIVGQTSAGKSSLANLIARFYEADSGEIIVGGHDVGSVTQESLRHQMGIVPQDPFLFSGSIEENIRYGLPGASHQEIIRAAGDAGAHEFITSLEQGYDTPVGERGSHLSTGQRQLICLARAILRNPPILILDEATSNVDLHTEYLIQQSLQRLRQQRTCLIIAHRLSTVTNADRIIVLERGKIAETGTHQELIALQGIYYNLYHALQTPTEGPN